MASERASEMRCCWTKGDKIQPTVNERRRGLGLAERKKYTAHVSLRVHFISRLRRGNTSLIFYDCIERVDALRCRTHGLFVIL